MIDLEQITGFDWDEGNARKNQKHGVAQAEAEEVFFNQPLLLLDDTRHGDREARYHALGKTLAGRLLHVTFTLRGNSTLVRVISARAMHRRERSVYEQAP
jgi:uncharacterized DUF497 family protein